MTNIDYESSRRPHGLKGLLARLGPKNRRPHENATRHLFCLSSLSLIAIGILLMILGAVCQSTSALPDWTGIAPVTAGLVILIFLTGRHS